MNRTVFTPKKIEFIIEHIKEMNYSELSRKLDISAETIRKKCYELGLSRKTDKKMREINMSDDEIALLVKLKYEGYTWGEIKNMILAETKHDFSVRTLRNRYALRPDDIKKKARISWDAGVTVTEDDMKDAEQFRNYLIELKKEMKVGGYASVIIPYNDETTGRPAYTRKWYRIISKFSNHVLLDLDGKRESFMYIDIKGYKK